MKKFIKMSLIAATAISSLSTSVGAKTLADIADNIDVFGYAQVRYDDRSTDANTGNSIDNGSSYTHKEVLGLTGKISDDLSYMFAGAQLSSNQTDESIGYQGFLMVYNYFTYTGIKNTSISAGRQGLSSPLTVVYDPATATSEANGVSLTTKLGKATINAAYYSSTNFDLGDKVSVFPGTAIDGGESYTNLGITGNAGSISFDAWYAEMEDKYNSFTIGASTKIVTDNMTVAPFARYTSADIDNVDADQKLWKAGVDVKVSIFGAGVSYGQTHKEGGWVTFDKEAEVNLEGWQLGLLGNADADLMKVNVNVDVISDLNIALNYADMNIANQSQSEIYLLSKYQMTPSFSGTVTLGQVDIDGESDKRDLGRVELLWIF